MWASVHPPSKPVPGLTEKNDCSEITENCLDTDVKSVTYKFSFLCLLYFIEVQKLIHSRNTYSEYTTFKLCYELWEEL